MLNVQDVDLTPNPQALKFILNEKILERETRNFKNKEEAQSDPLAKAVFEIEGVVSVFYMQKFVTIEKDPSISWGQIQKPFVELIKSFDKSVLPPESEVVSSDTDDNELLIKVNEILDQRVRPALAGDGGGLEVLNVSGNMVTISYHGACGSCPSAIHGTLSAIENLLKREISPAIEVVSE